MSIDKQQRNASWLFSFFFLWALVAIATIVNIRWIWLYRRDQLLDIDESGYLSISMNDYQHLINGGIADWWNTVLSPSIQAPIMTALTSLVFFLFNNDVIFGFVVPSFFFVATVVFVFLISNTVGGKYNAIFSSLLFITAPLAINYSRSFNFAIAGTAFTALAMLCLVCWLWSRRWYWAIAFGVSVGLMPLARTMTVAFIPGLLLGAFIANWAETQGRLARYAWLVLGLACGVAVAAVWLIPSGAMVADYLLNFGYGAQAQDYGQKVSFLDGLGVTTREFANQIYLPHFAVVGIGLLIAASIFLSRCFRGPRAYLAASLASPMLPVVVFAIAAVAAVSSTQNRGTGFLLPILPSLFVIAGWGFVNLATTPIRKLAAAVVLGATCVYAIVPLLDLHWPRAHMRVATLPLLGEVILKAGGGTQQRYEAGGRVNTDNPGLQLDPKLAKAWLDLNAETQAKIFNEPGKSYPTAFGFRGYVYNVNSVQLEQVRRWPTGIALVQITPASGDDALEVYRRWLVDGEAKRSCLLLTAPGTDAEIAPYVDVPTLEAAARATGFAPADNWTMPNGRPVTMWKRDCPPQS